MTPTNTKKELKNVKHVFSRDEKEKISQDLVGELAKQSGLEAEAKQVKSSYTAKLDEASARRPSARMQSSGSWTFASPWDGILRGRSWQRRK